MFYTEKHKNAFTCLITILLVTVGYTCFASPQDYSNKAEFQIISFNNITASSGNSSQTPNKLVVSIKSYGQSVFSDGFTGFSSSAIKSKSVILKLDSKSVSWTPSFCLTDQRILLFQFLFPFLFFF